MVTNDKIGYPFATSMWRIDEPGGWYFVSLPAALSQEIRAHLGGQEEGWGRMRAVAEIGATTWETSIWFDTKRDTYVLPIKAAIRRAVKLELDALFEMRVWL